MANIFRRVMDVLSGRFNDPNDTAIYDDGGKRTYNDTGAGNDFGSAVHDSLPGSGASRPNVPETDIPKNEEPPPSAERHREVPPAKAANQVNMSRIVSAQDASGGATMPESDEMRVMWRMSVAR
ncbi:hypothetical protein CNMCM5793_002304 [Aspergillus hiratsukae]|uniref:Uncharacterized protein n=1 Tax=Aspergillus hiratsukae TaxID=1194566 RepID=A0A8H6PD22_9EURO|nr:hypothetical protein CNMCM5793_002304 [Aspergillus hiratsukae]